MCNNWPGANSLDVWGYGGRDEGIAEGMGVRGIGGGMGEA